MMKHDRAGSVFIPKHILAHNYTHKHRYIRVPRERVPIYYCIFVSLVKVIHLTNS